MSMNSAAARTLSLFTGKTDDESPNARDGSDATELLQSRRRRAGDWKPLGGSSVRAWERKTIAGPQEIWCVGEGQYERRCDGNITTHPDVITAGQEADRAAVPERRTDL